MAEENQGNYGGKRPLWQWIILYLIIGGIIYALIYYFVISPNNGLGIYTPPQNTEQTPTSGY